jgi:hypothetical protein
MTCLVLKNSGDDAAEAEYAHPSTAGVAVGRAARPIWRQEPAVWLSASCAVRTRHLQPRITIRQSARQRSLTSAPLDRGYSERDGTVVVAAMSEPLSMSRLWRMVIPSTPI